MGRLDQPLPAVEVLRGLQERNLVFQLEVTPTPISWVRPLAADSPASTT